MSHYRRKSKRTLPKQHHTPVLEIRSCTGLPELAEIYVHNARVEYRIRKNEIVEYFHEHPRPGSSLEYALKCYKSACEQEEIELNARYGSRL